MIRRHSRRAQSLEQNDEVSVFLRNLAPQMQTRSAPIIGST